MKYAYILQSTAVPDRFYTGIIDDLRPRLIKHNAGEVSHTSKFKPWQLKTYIASLRHGGTDAGAARQRHSFASFMIGKGGRQMRTILPTRTWLGS